MVAQALDIAKETYFAILMDRDSGGPVMVGSPDGGVDIEQVAATNPSHIFKVHAKPLTKLSSLRNMNLLLTMIDAIANDDRQISTLILVQPRTKLWTWR